MPDPATTAAGVQVGEKLAGAVLSGLAGAGAAPAGPAISGTGQFRTQNGQYIHIAPVGLNVGEILRPFEGTPETGGAGVTSTWLSAGDTYTPPLTQGAGVIKKKLPTWVIAGGGLVAGLAVVSVVKFLRR